MSNDAQQDAVDLAFVAHELRTPLAVIAGYVELLTARDDEQTRREAALRIQDAVERLSATIDRLEDGRLAAAPGDASGARTARARLGRQLPQSGRNWRILIVDDDATLRNLIRMTLPTDGFDILEARDGVDALEQIRAGVPDLVILDWNMPQAPGSHVLGQLQADHPGLPVVVLTAERRRSNRALAEALGARTFLTKPFSPLDLLATVERLLAESGAAQLRVGADAVDHEHHVEADDDTGAGGHAND